MKKVAWPGKGWKFSCHRCGFWFPSTEIKKEWTGLLVCEACWEPRHPQTLIKVHGEKAFPDIVSKDGTDTFIAGRICNVATSSGYAGLGAADCMQAGWQDLPYTLLRDMFTNGHDSTGCACCDEGNSECVIPVPSFTYVIDTEDPYTVHFTNTTYIPPPFCATTYLWDFGDGTAGSSSSSVVTHTFESGTFIVELTAENDAGSGSIQESLTFAPSFSTELTVDFEDAGVNIAAAAALGVTFDAPFMEGTDLTIDGQDKYPAPQGTKYGGFHTLNVVGYQVVINIDTNKLRTRSFALYYAYTATDIVAIELSSGQTYSIHLTELSVSPWQQTVIFTDAQLTTAGKTGYVSKITFNRSDVGFFFCDALHFY